MDTNDPRAIAALQRAFLDGLADSTLLTRLSRAQNAREAERESGRPAVPVRGELARDDARRVVRRERHVTFVERRRVARPGERAA